MIWFRNRLIQAARREKRGRTRLLQAPLERGAMGSIDERALVGIRGAHGSGKVSDLRVAVPAVGGLACMFAGIWLSDAALFGAVDASVDVLAMRAATLFVYAAFLAIVVRFVKRGSIDVRWLLGALSIAGLLAFCAGSFLMLFVLSGMTGSVYGAVRALAFVLVKTLGAPVSVGLVCVFARLQPASVVRSCTLGMIGAFAVYSMLSQSSAVSSFGSAAPVVIGGVLLTASLGFGMVGMGGAPSIRPKAQEGRFGSALLAPGVVKRPWRKVLTPGFAIMVVFSAIMLGLSRNGFGGTDAHSSPASLAVLVALLVLAVVWRGLRVEHVFYAALLCTAAGVLLQPALDFAAAGGAKFVCGLGTALFEVVMWALVVWAARNCDETLFAASFARLIAVFGHLLGTAVVAAGFLLASTPDDALRASELFVVFAYMVLLVVLLKFPTLQVPFAAPASSNDFIPSGVEVEALDDASALREAAVKHDFSSDAAADGLAADQARGNSSSAKDDAVPTCVNSPEKSPISAESRIKGPCDIIARTYRLTAREREVLELIARGRDMPFMEETLVISRNTLKMHFRHIYTKLDVHSKQDIIDMVETLAR